MTCSSTHRRQLFDAVRAGLGQFGVIVRARVRLVPALPSTRYYKETYDDLSIFLSDLLVLIHDGRFDTVQGFVNALAGGGWNYTLEATKNFAPGHEPNDATLLAGLRFLPGQQTSQDIPYFDYLNRVGPTVEFLKQIGVWGFPHPWIDLLVPTSEAESFIGGTLAALDPADVGQGPILVYPYLGNLFDTPISACRRGRPSSSSVCCARPFRRRRSVRRSWSPPTAGSTSRRGRWGASSIRWIPCR